MNQAARPLSPPVPLGGGSGNESCSGLAGSAEQGRSPSSLPLRGSFSPAPERRSEQASLLLREAGLEHRH